MEGKEEFGREFQLALAEWYLEGVPSQVAKAVHEETRRLVGERMTDGLLLRIRSDLAHRLANTVDCTIVVTMAGSPETRDVRFNIACPTWPITVTVSLS